MIDRILLRNAIFFDLNNTELFVVLCDPDNLGEKESRYQLISKPDFLMDFMICYFQIEEVIYTALIKINGITFHEDKIFFYSDVFTFIKRD